MSIVSRTFAEVGNAIKDAYANIAYGDDAGTSTTKVLIVHPKSVRISGRVYDKFDLGMSFLNVNDRAYVQKVEMGSLAHRNGIRSQDCLQLAVVLGGKGDEDGELEDIGKETEIDDDEQNNSNAYSGNKRAIKLGLDLEKRGKRTSFEELKALFENCTLDVDDTGGGMGMFDDAQSQTQSLSTATTVQNLPFSRRIRSTTQEMVGRCSGFDTNAHLIHNMQTTSQSPSDSSGNAEYPVVLVFRCSHKRHVGNTTPHVGVPYFRLDEECERAAMIIQRLAPLESSKDDAPWDENASVISSQPKDKKGSNGGNASFCSAPLYDGDNDVEVETIRGMIQNALGLAFVRTSKVVLGVSFHFGSGIVISRLNDGTWSAPSAIGMYGAGLGVQFGLEVADYIFILQTEEALNHFRQGTNYTIGGNMGAAVGHVGREAYGAASVGINSSTTTSLRGGSLSQERSKLAPIVAYAKSQGLYFGVSLEGSKIFAREDMNRRAYKFTTGKEFSTDDILSGRVPAPREAEGLYATLHSVEFVHDIVNLPDPPHILTQDLSNDWTYRESTLSRKEGKPYDFFSTLSGDELGDMASFEAKFKTFLYGGVSVQRLLPRSLDGGGIDALERRTLWLMLPERGSLRLGFVSKQYVEIADEQSVFSEGGKSAASDFTSDSKSTMNSAAIRKKLRKVKLSEKHSLALTEITSLKRTSANAGNPNDDEKAMKVIEVVDSRERVLLFIANTVQEAEILFSGLKLMIEKETTRIGVRGGVPLTQLIASCSPLRPSKRDLANESSKREEFVTQKLIQNEIKQFKSQSSTEYSSSGEEDDDDNEDLSNDENIPEGRQSWSQVPTRNHLRTEALQQRNDIGANKLPEQSTVLIEPPSPQESEQGVPRYFHGDQLITDIATNVKIHLPLPLCRALFLDSTSPLMKRWEIDRGDINYSYTKWNIPPSSPRHVDNDLPENQMLSVGSMQGAHRSILFDRLRNGQRIRLSETSVVMMDDSETVSITISERMPRRGFSTKVRITILKDSKQSCSISIFGDIVPIGKDLSNQGAVHRAFLLVVDEMKGRYGTEEGGLFKTVMTFPSSNTKKPQAASPNKKVKPKISSHIGPDVSKIDKAAPVVKRSLPASEVSADPAWTPSASKNFFPMKAEEKRTPRRSHQERVKVRPSTPAIARHTEEKADNSLTQPVRNWATSEFVEWDNAFADMPMDDTPPNSNMTIDVKPLPKLRLDLMPVPREEDEDNVSTM